jgi:hypothetical protein
MPETVRLTVGAQIGPRAFAALFAAAVGQQIPSTITTGTINIEIEIQGSCTIGEGAFSQLSAADLGGFTLGSATVSFATTAAQTVSIGAGAFSGLNISTLQLPANTTLQPNALTNIQTLRVLDVSQLVTPIVQNALNLTRGTAAPLIVQMPTSSAVTYQQGSVVIPPSSAAAGSTTIVFNQSVPDSNTLQQMFTVPTTVASAVQVSLNYETTSNVSSQQLSSLSSSLTTTVGGVAQAPQAVSYNAIQTAISQISANNTATPTVTGTGSVESISQFAGDYFEYLQIAPSVSADAKALKQCVVTGLTADAIANRVTILPIPSSITPSKTAEVPNPPTLNVVGVVSNMVIQSTTFYIMENFYDPTNATITSANVSVPLVAIFSKANASSAGFFPAILVNGSISQKDGSLFITGSRTANAYLYGYNMSGTNTFASLLTGTVGTSVPLHDKGSAANAIPIATLTYTSTDIFTIQITPIAAKFSSNAINGAFQNYIPTTATGTLLNTKVNFTNIANAANVAWNNFSTRVGTAITNNNALVSVIANITTQSAQLPQAVVTTIGTAIPTPVSIATELAALSASDFNAYAVWKALEAKFTAYNTYLNALITYVSAALAVNALGNTAFPQYAAQFGLVTSLSQQLAAAITAVRADLLANAGVVSLYANAVTPYISARLNVGPQTFKNCTSLNAMLNFEFLRNISVINDETFYFCNALKTALCIPINVVSIGKNAFYGCTNVLSIDIQSATALRIIGISAFESCSNAVGSLSFSTAIGASDSVESIGDKAFFGCAGLTDHLYFPPKMKQLGVAAFQGCRNLNGTIVFPTNANFTTIPDLAFNGCSSLTGVSSQTGNGTSLMYLPSSGKNGVIPDGLIIPPAVTKIGLEAFKGCTAFAGALNLQYAATNAIAQIGDSAFEDCSSFTSLVLPTTSLVQIPFKCFKNCNKLTALNIPAAITSIMGSAFHSCAKIANIPSLDNVTYIGNDAFSGCTSMTGALILGASLEILGNNAFYNCMKLTSATFLGPPPVGFNTSLGIFDVPQATASTVAFYVNVFAENGWDGTAIPAFKINDVFRAYKSSASSNLVHMSFIDFKINYSASNAPTYTDVMRELTINQYNSFYVYDNTSAGGANAAVTVPAEGYSWNDVCIPGIVRGYNLLIAKNSVAISNQSGIAKVLSSSTSLIDAVQVDSGSLLTSMYDWMRTFDGSNIAIAGSGTTGSGTTTILEQQVTTLPTIPNASATQYFVYTVATGATAGDYLHYYANGAQPVLVTSKGSNLNFFTATSAGTATSLAAYNNKIIKVNSVGKISVSTITPVGYDLDTGVVVSTSSDVPPQQTSKYTVYAPANPAKLYFGDYYASPGAYLILSATGTGSANYTKNVVYVGYDGVITIPELTLQHVTYVSNAASAGTNAPTAGTTGYSIRSEYPVPNATTGANTTFALYNGTTLAESGQYFIQSSMTALVDNVIVSVMKQGAISIGDVGLTGAANLLSNYSDSLVSQSIPIYDTNSVYVNFNDYITTPINLALKETDYNIAASKFAANYEKFNADYLQLQYNIDSANGNALNDPNTLAVKTAFTTLKTNYTKLFIADGANLSYYDKVVSQGGDGINQKYDNYVSTLKMALGYLKDIQTVTLTSSEGIQAFQRACTYNAAALTMSPLALANDLTYVTDQINTFISKYLLVVKGSQSIGSAVSGVNGNVQFKVSPSTSIDKFDFYAGLSIQQKILADFTSSFLTLWYNSALSSTNTNPWSGLQASTVADNDSAVLAWATTNVLTPLKLGQVTIYQQFINNNPVPSLEQIRTIIAAYAVAPGTSSAAAIQPEYAKLVKVPIVNALANFTSVVAATNPAPTAALANGTVTWASNADATTLYISAKNAATPTPVDISFSGYVDTISFNAGALIYKVNSVQTDTHSNHVLSVTKTSGTLVANATALTITTYQTSSTYTMAKMSTLAVYVYGKYSDTPYQLDTGTYTGIKALITAVKTAIVSETTTLSNALNQVESQTALVLSNINAVNAAQDNSIAVLKQLQNAALIGANQSSSQDLAGAQMLSRELELFELALKNLENGNQSLTPVVSGAGVVPIPAYESEWFQSRVAAFWAAYPVSAFNIINRADAYNTANLAFKTSRYARQTAMINAYIAASVPTENIPPNSLIPTKFIRSQAVLAMETIPVYILPNQNDFAALFSARLIAYLTTRDAAIAGITDTTAKQTAMQANKAKQIALTTEALRVANYNYGIVAFQRYMAVIDLAIVNAYYGTISAGAQNYNKFQIDMDIWNKHSNKQLIFDTSLKPFIFNAIYNNANAGVTYTAQNFPLRSGVGTGGATPANTGEYLTLFLVQTGTVYDGWLYTLAANGLALYNAILLPQHAPAIPLSAYDIAGKTSTELIDNLSVLTSAQFYARLIASNTVNRTAVSLVLTLFANLQYKVVSLDNSLSPAAGQGITAISAQVMTANGNSILYSFVDAASGGATFYGYQQASDLINSWAKLSPNQNVVFFYQSLTTNPVSEPANLYSASQTSLTTFCDNAKFVMIIELVGAVRHYSLYSYDAMGLASGVLRSVGTITTANGTTTVSVNTIVGPLQKIAANPKVLVSGSLVDGVGINLVGDLVIPNQIKTVGVNAFSGQLKLKSLAFGNGVNTVSIGSNAFQSCSGISAINLSSTIVSIGNSAFLNCTGATSLTLPPVSAQFNNVVTTVNHFAFLGCNNLGSATNGNLVIPTNVNQINVQAFANCSKLQCQQLSGGNSYLPESLQKIGAGAFIGCIGLTGALNFNNQNAAGSYVSTISFLGSAAFMGCTGLNGALSLPINVNYKNVLPYTFASADAPMYNSNNGLPITFTPTPLATPMALTGAIDLNAGSVPSSIVSFERAAFYKCAALISLNLSNIVTQVGVQSFKYCSGLNTTLVIPASVKTIRDEAFMGCAGIPSLNIVAVMVSQNATEAWLSIGNSAFQDCIELALSNTAVGLVIPNSVSSIGDSAFQGCTNIVSVNVGSGLSKAGAFGSSVFSGCIKLARVSLGFSFLANDGSNVVKNTVLPTPNPTNIVLNNSFTGCLALGVPSATNTPTGTIQIQSGATGWTPGRVGFFNFLTVVVNNKNITFYLKEFDKLAQIAVVDPTQDAVQMEAIPITDAQANVYVKASELRKVFRTSTDSFVNQTTGGAVEHGQLFYVLPEYFPKYLNVANAHVSQGGIESYNAATYEQLVKDDVMRYYAMSLFNSADWTTLFANDTEMIENMVASSGLMPIVPDGEVDAAGKHLYNTGVLYNIMTELNKISTTKPPASNSAMVQSTNYPPASTEKWWAMPDTALPEQGNIGKKLFNIINRNDPGRITSMVLNGATPSELPFLPGDQFIFVFTLNENTVNLSQDIKVVVKARKYLIKLILTEDFNSGTPAFMDHAMALYKPSSVNKNVLPVSGAYAADYMYSDYNLYLANKPSVVDQTSTSVYSKVTQNVYEPIAIPTSMSSLLPFTGWYYSYPTNSQSLKLNFTPPDLSLTNKTYYNDMRYLSAYVYFPNAWSSLSALPNPNNFPQWVVTFTNDGSQYTIKYKAQFANNTVVNFLGQTTAFDYTNTHVQLLCPFSLQQVIPGFETSPLSTLLKGATADGTQVGIVSPISATAIYRQTTNLPLVSGLRNPTSTIGPFTYPPVSRGYQCIPMPTTALNGLQASQVYKGTTPIGLLPAPGKTLEQVMTELTADPSTFRLDSVSLEINMSNNDGFVPSIIVKSVEVVTKNYEAYYLAPLDPN